MYDRDVKSKTDENKRCQVTQEMTEKATPVSKQEEILTFVREQVASGVLEPGDRTPTRQDFEAQFATTRVTVQRAFDRLLADGVVVARGRQGTFVADRPPRLFQYALACPTARETGTWSKFWTVIGNVARAMDEAGPRKIRMYTGIDKSLGGSDYDALLDDVAERRLAGIIFSSNPFPVMGTRLLDEPDLPRVAFMSADPRWHIPAVWFRLSDFLDRALDFLVERGRRRVALLTFPQMKDADLACFQSAAERRGMDHRPQWTHAVPQSDPRWASNAVLAMLHADASVKPDALIILDDNLVECACTGVVAAHRRVSEDLDIVAHCNFPAPAACALPLFRLGYDIQELLEVSFGLLDVQRSGETAPPVTLLPPRFESELPTRTPETSAFGPGL